MGETASNARKSLTTGQLTLIARKMGVFSGKSLVDVGCGDGRWLAQLRSKGRNVSGMEQKASAGEPSQSVVAIGSPSAAVPWESHTQDTILFRGTSAFDAAEFSPELMIGLANLGSSLKSRGRLLIPLLSPAPTDLETELVRWKSQLSIFPGTIRTRLLTPGLGAYLTLAFLFNRVEPISVIEFQVNRALVSRLEWHRLARTAVMSQMAAPAVAG